jgi:hypothetical protein
MFILSETTDLLLKHLSLGGPCLEKCLVSPILKDKLRVEFIFKKWRVETEGILFHFNYILESRGKIIG